MRRALSTAAAAAAAPHPPPPRPIRGVLFDLDGTLVDTEFISPLAWIATLKDAGVQLSAKDEEEITRVVSAPAMRGANAATIADHFIRTQSIEPERRAWLAQRKREHAVEIALGRGGGSAQIDLAEAWFPGAAASVRRLSAVLGGVDGSGEGQHGGVGLCTSNLRPVVAATLAAGGMADAFEVGGTTVQEDVVGAGGQRKDRMKPSPAPYARALRLLGRPRRSVAAVEDSVVGVRSAVAAGVGVVLGVLNRGQDGDAEEAADVAAALTDAGAFAVFSDTRQAIDWCVTHAAADAADVAYEMVAVGRGAAVKPRQRFGEGEQEAARAKEAVVRRYFEGVNRQDGSLIASCFSTERGVRLRDMCNPLSRGELRRATPEDMADRCLEFLAAHPDCRVRFEAPPRTERMPLMHDDDDDDDHHHHHHHHDDHDDDKADVGGSGGWVWCHWAETGNWTGESRGVPPQGTPLEVGGHTRFLVELENGEWRITEQVVYRTFADWELALLSK